MSTTTVVLETFTLVWRWSPLVRFFVPSTGSLVLLAHLEPCLEEEQELVQETTTPKAPSNPRLLKKKHPGFSTRMRPGFKLTRMTRTISSPTPRLQLLVFKRVASSRQRWRILTVWTMLARRNKTILPCIIKIKKRS
jgi:hypothetical protein